MRTYGRVIDIVTKKITWVEVTTDANGYDDAVWLTTVCQVLLLNLGESPFWANWGIPGHPSVISQIFPDYYVAITQQRFAQYFASLLISKQPAPNPTYRVAVLTHQGATAVAKVPF